MASHALRKTATRLHLRMLPKHLKRQLQMLPVFKIKQVQLGLGRQLPSMPALSTCFLAALTVHSQAHHQVKKKNPCSTSRPTLGAWSVKKQRTPVCHVAPDTPNLRRRSPNQRENVMHRLNVPSKRQFAKSKRPSVTFATALRQRSRIRQRSRLGSER